MSEWISTADKLPIDEGKILVVYGEPSFGEFYPEIECAYYEEGIWRFWLSDREISTNGVTHWKPLPKLPNE